MQLAEALAEAFLSLLFTDRKNAHTGVDVACLLLGKEADRCLRVIQDEVLEILVVAHRLAIHTSVVVGKGFPT